jgi:hypothetical protein
MFSFEFTSQRMRSWGIAALMAGALLASPAAWAQSALQAQSVTVGAQNADPTSEVPLQMSGSGAASAPNSAVSASPGYHILPANTEAGRRAALNGTVAGMGPSSAQALAKVKPLAGLASPGFFPADMSDFGGTRIGSGSSEDIYYNCGSSDESCWGDPEGFLFNLSNSKFIHVVDQYIGLKTNKRYPLSSTFVFENGGPTNLTATDVENAVHTAALLDGVGPGHIFHLFLPQGFTVCAQNNVCYSPNNPSTFVFCAYHSSVSRFSDTGTLLYTVEPFQDVTGCVLAPPNPNSPMIDSTNSALSHELFELITDPFPGSDPAWIAIKSSPEQGNEIGDICHGPGDGFGEIIAPSYFLTNGHSRIPYQTQLEYSNLRHGCVVTP